MRLSTIAKYHEAGGWTAFARTLGSEIKRRRLALGLSQAHIGGPLSRAYISSVEGGRLTPSLPSLLIIARQLNASAAAILASVERELEAQRRDGSADETSIPR